MYKIAVPSRDGMIDEHFGHCQYFTVFTVNDDKAVVGEETFTPPPQCGCKSNLVGTLRDMQVKVLIGGNMGDGAAAKLRSHGIQVVRGAAGPVAEAVAAFLAGNLTDSKEVCHSHECGDHDHGHEDLSAKMIH
ncbi:Dinitrogenase iron-molybdenum cofactor biosynthesis protein [Desulfovibrio sp. X2]|uniref:NifB/NifX family molybdenum-iron cluster-binding protein n=1 Tax=Desulfovibrio sp. X2 TaxID=941449 RepID=UPI000358AAF8|nr:NifB/NifX family molybdenum-iron cluster-binding protein [Desulfovibrio sp. X2]EPR43783.1 Dinitrogenase iron-molybdenum cofactor biosynthesis protein [Desulfovibrio sp. X2]